MKLLILLQNAWKRGTKPGQTEWLPGRGRQESRIAWTGALLKSPTGVRLDKLLLEVRLGANLCYADVSVENASSLIANRPQQRFPADFYHVRLVLNCHEPDAVLLLGKEARRCRELCEAVGAVVVEGPHPSSRKWCEERGRLVEELKEVLK